MPIEIAEQLITEAIAEKIFSASSLKVIYKGKTVHHQSYGKTAFGDTGKTIDNQSLFDLASLTKILATTTAIARLCELKELALFDKACKYLPDWNVPEKREVTISQLLQHCSGLPDWKPYYKSINDLSDKREQLFRLVASEPLINKPGEVCLYSDLDFIALTEIIEKVSQKHLDHFVKSEIFKHLNISDLFYLPLDEPQNLQDKIIVATENCPYRGLLQGRVHDDNSYKAGGVMGHAGLFGTADSVTKVLTLWQQALLGTSDFLSQQVALDFCYPANTPANCSHATNCSHVLGFDRPVWKKSQAGRFISPHSIGHLGFTGCSAWLDFDKDLIIVLTSNRVHESRSEDRMPAFRKALHNAIYQNLDATYTGPFGKIRPAKDCKTIHLSAIAGTGMGSLAGMLKKAGYVVSGSDEAIYPPMSTLLAKQNIPVMQPFSPNNLKHNPDLVIIGNALSRDNIEVQAVRRMHLDYDSFPGVLEKFFLADHKSLVATGTHGKTTTCSMLSWMLEYAGFDPGFMIGGLLNNFGTNNKLGSGEYFVVEGDEYDSAYFDKYPKFMHYKPFGAIITSIEFDHADIFDSLEEIEEHFASFVRLIPESGFLAACFDYENVRRIAKEAGCTVLSYGQHPQAEYQASDIEIEKDGTRFTITKNHEILARVKLPMFGNHNISNFLAVAALLHKLDYPLKKLAPAIAEFKGIARRQEVRGVINGVSVIDDFAHHPTAIKVTLEGLKQNYPNGKLLVAFDPRTNTSSRNIFQREFASSFESADMVLIGNPSRMDRIAKDMQLDPKKLAEDIEKLSSIKAEHLADINQMAVKLVKQSKTGDAIVILSNGGFGGIHQKVLDLLGRINKEIL